MNIPEFTSPARFRRISNESGGALLFAVGILVTLGILSGLVLNVIGNKHRQAFQTAAWRLALVNAESGIDKAMFELKTKIRLQAGTADTSFTGWQSTVVTDPAGKSSTIYERSFTRPDATAPGGAWTWTKVTVSPIVSTMEVGDPIHWWRIRAIGYEPLPKGSIQAGDSKEVALRKLDLINDHRESQAGREVPVPKPMASRMVEVIVKPVGTFNAALFGDSRIDMNNLNIVVDSYDSRDPNKSDNGFYPLPANSWKVQKNGDIVTNGKAIDVGNATIKGDASTNGGSVLRASNVTGKIRDDFYQELPLVTRPTMTPDFGSPSVVRGSSVLTAKATSAAQIILSTIDLKGQNTLIIAGSGSGTPTYMDILVTGDVALGGQGQIVLGPGVKLRMFVVGNADFTGGGVANPNSPLNFQLYGVEQYPDGSGNVPVRNFKIAGNGGFRGAVYAPNYDIDMVGGGSTDSIFGAFVGRNINMTGGQAVHYDEALGAGGLYSDFRIVSWFEDSR